MNYFKIIAIIITILGLSLSCTKLDEDVYSYIPGEQYPENDEQVANLSVGAYTPLYNLIDDNGWWFLAQEISGDGMCAPTRGSDWFDGGKWLVVHRHTWNNDTESVNRMWSAFWEGITKSNQILDMFRQIEPSESINAKIAEVEVMRSFYYYLLIDNYGDAPYLITANVADDFQPKKVAREIIYDSLINTVERSLSLLKAEDIKYLATRYMGFSLLSKLYLNAEIYTGTANWEKAGQYCDSIIAGPYTLSTDVSSPFKVENQNSSELIFSIPFDEDNISGFRLHMRTLHYQHNLTYDMAAGPWNGFAIVPTFFDVYEEQDLRKQNWFIWGTQYASNGDTIVENVTGVPLVIDPYLPALEMVDGYTDVQIRTSGARIGKYEIKSGTKENLSNDFPLFRLTDFYLMKAECEIRMGRSGDEWINPLRTRAGVDPITGWTLDQLLEERGREMYAEGHRRQDLIRFEKWGLEWWEKDSHSESDNTFPIPKWAIDTNPNLGN
jgi:hypothetical protein